MGSRQTAVKEDDTSIREKGPKFPVLGSKQREWFWTTPFGESRVHSELGSGLSQVGAFSQVNCLNMGFGRKQVQGSVGESKLATRSWVGVGMSQVRTETYVVDLHITTLKEQEQREVTTWDKVGMRWAEPTSRYRMVKGWFGFISRIWSIFPKGLAWDVSVGQGMSTELDGTPEICRNYIKMLIWLG